jgi:hypothetical protein
MLEAITAARVAITPYWLKPVRHNKVKWISIFPPIPSATFLLRVAKVSSLSEIFKTKAILQKPN